MDKRRKKRLLILFSAVILVATAVILVTAGIVLIKLHPHRPLHEQIADYMYHSRTDPKLEYCIEKYGDEFVATEYGSILSTRFPNFYVQLDWSEEEKTYKDNYIVYLRQEELAATLKPIMETIFGECKLFVFGYNFCPSAFGKDTSAEELLSVAPEDGPVVQINLFTTKNPTERDADIQQLINLIQERGYSICVNVKYLSEENYKIVTADNHLSDLVIGRDFYKYFGSISIYPDSFEWHRDGWKKGNG